MVSLEVSEIWQCDIVPTPLATILHTMVQSAVAFSLKEPLEKAGLSGFLSERY